MGGPSQTNPLRSQITRRSHAIDYTSQSVTNVNFAKVGGPSQAEKSHLGRKMLFLRMPIALFLVIQANQKCWWWQKWSISRTILPKLKCKRCDLWQLGKKSFNSRQNYFVSRRFQSLKPVSSEYAFVNFPDKLTLQPRFKQLTRIQFATNENKILKNNFKVTYKFSTG